MPFPPQAPPPERVAVEQPAAVSQAALLEMLVRQARDVPQAAFEQASALHHEEDSDRVRRLAFLAAASRQRDLAAIWLPDVIDRPWLGEVSLYDAVALAASAPEEHGERLVRAAVSRNPSLALREAPLYSPFPFGAAVFEEAVRGAPDEAAALAAGHSPISQSLLEALRDSDSEEVRVLAEIAKLHGIDQPRRARVAVLHREIARGTLTLERAVEIAGSMPRYFAALIDLRLGTNEDAVRSLDRVLERQSLILCRAFQEGPGAAELGAFAVRDLYLVLAYSRAEHDDTFFQGIFDRLLAPKLRAAGTGALPRLLDTTRNLKLRAFVTTALYFRRFEQFLTLAGPETARAAVVQRVIQGIEQTENPLEEAVIAAEIVEGTSNFDRLRLMGSFVAAEHDRMLVASDSRAAAIYGVLAARVAQKLPHPPHRLRAIGDAYRPHFREFRALDSAALFSRDGVCLQRHFFYNDLDGVESFDSFLATYHADPRWAIRDHGGWVHLTARGAGGRRIEIYANVPVDVLDRRNAKLEAEAALRQMAVSRVLSDRGLTPSVIVHRGHAYHVDATLDHLASTTQFVFLGSCRGLGKVHTVMETSPEAHVIASRNVGSLSVNDPILKSLNDQLLAGGDSVDWPAFWQAQQARLGRNGSFADYIAPHRNPASIFLRAYFSAVRGGAP